VSGHQSLYIPLSLLESRKAGRQMLSLSLSLLTAVFSSGSGRGSLLDDKPMTALDLAASCHVPPETRRTLCSEASEVAVSLLLPCKDADGYADVFECLMPTVGE